MDSRIFTVCFVTNCWRLQNYLIIQYCQPKCKLSVTKYQNTQKKFTCEKVYAVFISTGVSEVAGYITPVPGGVGPMTVAMLMRNTILAAKHSVIYNMLDPDAVLHKKASQIRPWE